MNETFQAEDSIIWTDDKSNSYALQVFDIDSNRSSLLVGIELLSLQLIVDTNCLPDLGCGIICSRESDIVRVTFGQPKNEALHLSWEPSNFQFNSC